MANAIYIVAAPANLVILQVTVPSVPVQSTLRGQTSLQQMTSPTLPPSVQTVVSVTAPPVAVPAWKVSVGLLVRGRPVRIIVVREVGV